MLLAPQFSAAMSCVFWSFNFLLLYINCTYSVQCCFIITFSHMYSFVFAVHWPSCPSLISLSFPLIPFFSPTVLSSTILWCLCVWTNDFHQGCLQKHGQFTSGFATEGNLSRSNNWLWCCFLWLSGSLNIYLPEVGPKTKEVKIDLSTWPRACGLSLLAPARTELGLRGISSFLFIDSPNLQLSSALSGFSQLNPDSQ